MDNAHDVCSLGEFIPIQSSGVYLFDVTDMRCQIIVLRFQQRNLMTMIMTMTMTMTVTMTMLMIMTMTMTMTMTLNMTMTMTMTMTVTKK